MRLWPIALILCGMGQAFADDAVEPDPEELHPGLVARYESRGRSIERLDADVQFDWPDAGADARLGAGPFEARWTGLVLIRGEGRHAFHLYLRGAARLSIDDREATQGARDEPGWMAGEPLALEPGEHRFELTYRSDADGPALVRLFWASESFPLEPVPARALFHEAPRADLLAIERGQRLYEGLRCNRCHRREHEPLSPATAPLTAGASGLSRDWLVDWLSGPAGLPAHRAMPGFAFSRDEAGHVAEALVAQARPPEFDEEQVSDRERAFRSGEVLFRSVGCLACHVRDGLGAIDSLGGGDLTRIADKRPAGWLALWLKDPARIHPAHRMPVFALSDDERRELVVYLSGVEPPAAAAESKLNADRAREGQVLIERSRCTACHDDGKARREPAMLPSIAGPLVDWSQSCVDAPADRARGRPAYALDDGQRRDLKAFLAVQNGPLSLESPTAAATRLLRQNQCLSCHERDGGSGLAVVAKSASRADTELAGQSDALMPPDLTAVGDKLRDEWLRQAVRGEQRPWRLPWLRVRMPRFAHAEEDVGRLAQLFVAHDRVPPGGPQAPWGQEGAGAHARPTGSDEGFDAGRLLAGSRGFGCVGCHKVGKFEPRNVALATRGSDLYGLSQRMRPEYFARWLRSPIRVVPNLEMPSFDSPRPEVLEGDYARQVAALWSALNDPKGPPTLDTSVIEQTLVVEAGAAPAVVRDVFRPGEPANERSIPRALAIGLGNRVNVLFDLDACAVQTCWGGDFARQRAAGKSWFWEPAAPIARQATATTPDLALRPADRSDAPPIFARLESGRHGRLDSYRRQNDGLRLVYSLPFDLPTGECVARVTEEFLPAARGAGEGRSSFDRVIRVDGVPAGYEVVVRDGAEFRALGTRRADAGQITGEIRSPEIPVPGLTQKLPQGPAAALSAEPIRSVPGYEGVRLPLPWTIMPTAIAWTGDGKLAFTTLKGQVYLARDTDGDGLEDALRVFEQGLAAPYGLIAEGEDLLVAHKPELLRLRDVDHDGAAEVREVVADGWGYTDDYHDWTTGIVRDSLGNLYLGTGSDYARSGRDRDHARWRGKVLRVGRDGTIVPLGHAFRYPTGLAIDADDQVFVTDNQGVQNTFNEINHLVEGGRYGVPSLFEEPFEGAPRAPAIQVPHPWTRSVNGIFFLPRGAGQATTTGDGQNESPFAGHGIGCEYDSRFLVRFTLQRTGETYQGAVYPFSRPPDGQTEGELRGTLCGAVAPNGDLFIGSILDSGWLGGPNVGDLVRLRRHGPLPCGIREIRAYDGEFEISFTAPVNAQAAAQGVNFDVSGSTRVWQGTYATADSGRHKLAVKSVDVAADCRSVRLHVEGQKAGSVYEIRVGSIGPTAQPLWPAVGHYTLNRIPQRPAVNPR